MSQPKPKREPPAAASGNSALQFQKGDMVDLAVTDAETSSGRYEVLSVTGDKVKIRDRQSRKTGLAAPSDLRLYMRFDGGSAS